MALLAGGQTRRVRGPILHAVLLAALAALGAASIIYLLMPRWSIEQAGVDAPRLPISIAGVVFNIAPAAIRFPVQRRAGPQERIDLAYVWPDLSPPDTHAGLSMPHLFVDIEPAPSAMLPAERLRSVYPRYADAPSASGPGGLVIAAFRNDSPYAGEDLLYDPVAPDRFLVRCDRSEGPIIHAMCLYERTEGAASLTFRFPREWLADWHAVVDAADHLIEGWRPAGK